jgi:hypothetical protein
MLIPVIVTAICGGMALGQDAAVKLHYPSAPRGMEFAYGEGQPVLTVRLPKPLSARRLQITVTKGETNR